MQILEWGDLTDDQRAEAALIDWSDWNGPALVGLLHDPWLHGRPYQGYTSLVAVEGHRVLARVGTVRVSFRDRSGADPVLGVADVITDPRRLREGLATRLMEEVHRRARSDGLRASFLGTRVSWGAHRAYEKLGYRDVYSPPRSLRWVPREPPVRAPGTWKVRPGRRRDGPALQAVLERASEGRVGLLPRSEGWFESRLRLRWSGPNDYLLLRKDGETVGYAHLSRGFRQVTCTEAVPSSPELGAPLLDAIERRAAGRWLGLGTTTFQADMANELRRRGYHRIDRGHGVLMACPLGGGASRLVRIRRGFRDRRLFFHQPDSV